MQKLKPLHDCPAVTGAVGAGLVGLPVVGDGPGGSCVLEAAAIVSNAPSGDGTGTAVAALGAVAAGLVAAGVSVLTATLMGVAATPGVKALKAEELLFRKPETATYPPRQQIAKITIIAITKYRSCIALLCKSTHQRNHTTT